MAFYRKCFLRFEQDRPSFESFRIEKASNEFLTTASFLTTLRDANVSYQEQKQSNIHQRGGRKLANKSAQFQYAINCLLETICFAKMKRIYACARLRCIEECKTLKSFKTSLLEAIKGYFCRFKQAVCNASSQLNGLAVVANRFTAFFISPLHQLCILF